MSLLPRTEEALDKIKKSLETWKKMILEVHEPSEQQNQLNILKNHVQSYGQLEKEYDNTNLALQKLDQKLNSTPCEDIENAYTECFDNLTTSSNVNIKDSRIWQAVFEGICDVQEIYSKNKKLKDNQFEELGDSLMCSNVFTPPVDPISKTVLRNPYRNKRCGHAYEYSTIADYIKSMKQKAKCPYIGCSSQLRMTDLVEDKSLQTKITKYLESQSSSEDESDDNE